MVPYLLLLRKFLSIKFSLRSHRRVVVGFTHSVYGLRIHPLSAEETDQFVFFEFVIETLNFLTKILDDIASSFLDFASHSIFLCIKVCDEFP